MGDRTITPDPDDPIDCAVLEFQRGIRREENFNLIVGRFYKPVKAFLSKRGLSTDDSLDLNQETFSKVYTGLDGYGWKAKFPSWLFTIAFNVYRNWRDGELRRERIGPVASVANDAPAASGEEGEPVAIDLDKSQHEVLEGQELVVLLRRAVGELPPQMRRCVRLRLKDYSYEEIAQEMRLAIGTVKAHLHTAREKLRETLADFFDNIDF